MDIRVRSWNYSMMKCECYFLTDRSVEVERAVMRAFRKTFLPARKNRDTEWFEAEPELAKALFYESASAVLKQ